MTLNERPWEVNNYNSTSVHNFKKFFGLGNRGENSVETEREEDQEEVEARKANDESDEEEDEDNNNDSDNDDGDLLMPVVEWIGGMIPKLAKMN